MTHILWSPYRWGGNNFLSRVLFASLRMLLWREILYWATKKSNYQVVTFKIPKSALHRLLLISCLNNFDHWGLSLTSSCGMQKKEAFVILVFQRVFLKSYPASVSPFYYRKALLGRVKWINYLFRVREKRNKSCLYLLWFQRLSGGFSDAHIPLMT